jgi:hypothetical protein
VIDGLCRRWGSPPSVVLAEPGSVLRMLKIIELGTPEPEGGE